MLKAAHQRIQEDVEVVVGVVETHGRSETAELLKNLPTIPRKKIEYKGTNLEEMDLDAILEKKPELVLVDELAHTNVPGSRHDKRYQDVIELIDNGIDVFTTVNVQHLESRKEAVESIAKISIRETVPDSILDLAAMVEVVDIAPSELLKRLREGKVYLGDKATHAADNFFKEDKLTALREIALRLTAERVDQDLSRFVEYKERGGPWQTNERLMVAVSHSPYSEKLIRATRRIAYNLEAPWIAVHIDNGIQLNNDDQAQLIKNINLARELSAELITTTDNDVATALKRIAKQKNVTQIVVGRPSKRRVTDFLEGGTLLDRLVRESGNVDIHVIRQERIFRYKPPMIHIRRDTLGTITSYWYTLLTIIGAGVIGALLESLIGYRAVGFIFLLGVLFVGTSQSLGPTICAAALSAIVWNFFFIPPKYTFVISQPEDFIMCASYFIVASIVGYLTNRNKSNENLIREREERTNVLFEVSQDITSSHDKEEFLTKIIARVDRLLNGACGVILRSRDGKLLTEVRKKYNIPLDEKERAVATWSFNAGKPAGWSTDTLAEAKALYLPLKTIGETVGLFIYQPKTKRKLSVEQENLLYSIVQQVAIALEKHFYESRLREAERLEESEKLHQTLLNSISHEMRTPLTVIMGTATTLADENIDKSKADIKNAASELLDASDRLNRVIENLLDMSRLNSGVLAIKSEWHDIHDLVGVTLKKLGKNLSQHQIKVDLPLDLPLINIDFRLMEHALSNLILNATMYSPQGKEIRISSKLTDSFVRIIIEDEGSGIPESSLSKIFEKFYRVPGTPTGGTGLGLSIVKSIVEAHEGSIYAENRTSGGARFVIELPLKPAPSAPAEPLPPGEKS